MEIKIGKNALKYILFQRTHYLNDNQFFVLLNLFGRYVNYKFSVILKEDEGVANQQKLQDLLEQSLLEVASLRRELTELKTDLATMKENQTWHSS